MPIEYSNPVAPITGKNTIIIQRHNSIGDVIAASFVATRIKQHQLAERVIFIAYQGACTDILENHPDIDWVAPPSSMPADIVLDGIYENSEFFHTENLYDIFLWSAGISDTKNIIPRIGLYENETQRAAELLEKYPKPWIFLGLRSYAAPERTVSDKTWADLVADLHGFGGTIFSCGGPNESAINGTVDLVAKLSIRQYAAAMSMADLVVTVDSGHLHIAQAFNRPMVVIGMATDPDIRALPQIDYTPVTAGLRCQYCFSACRYNYQNPPCRNIDTKSLSNAVWEKLQAQTGNKISALIPVYKPNITRLHRCIGAVRNQVDEIVVGFDECTGYSEPILPPGCKIVRSETRLGYANMMNRLARESSGRFLLLLNDDVFMHPGSVQALRNATDEKTAVSGCLLYAPDGMVHHGGMFWDNTVKAYQHLDIGTPTASIKERCEMDAVTFASVLVRREAFFALRCFDERYDCYWEDVDFCTKAKKAGWKIMYEPLATGVHETSQSTFLLGEHKDAMFGHGHSLYLQKWKANNT